MAYAQKMTGTYTVCVESVVKKGRSANMSSKLCQELEVSQVVQATLAPWMKSGTDNLNYTGVR